MKHRNESEPENQLRIMLFPSQNNTNHIFLTAEILAIPAPTLTVTLAFFLLPSTADAVIFAEPSRSPLTTPFDVTVATFLLELVQTTFL